MKAPAALTDGEVGAELSKAKTDAGQAFSDAHEGLQDVISAPLASDSDKGAAKVVQAELPVAAPVDKEEVVKVDREALAGVDLEGAVVVLEALAALEKDHEFLLQGDVFTEDVISTWVWYKRDKEVDALRLRPHPYEFALYFDV